MRVRERRAVLACCLALTTAAGAMAAGCARSAPPEVRDRAGTPTRVVSLPAPDTRGTMALDEAIAKRRSSRTFAATPLPLSLIGQLLWAGQGLTAPDGKRAAPSAGGLYPIELYVVTAHEIMHYLPAGHRVEVRATADVRAALGAAALGQAFVAGAPAIVVVAAVPARTRVKYGARGDTFAALEAGHVTQNILLEATERSLASTPVGGIDADRVRRALALAPGTTVEYLVPLGYP
jgi:SagB-type dehydrogenase family enzyme